MSCRNHVKIESCGGEENCISEPCTLTWEADQSSPLKRVTCICRHLCAHPCVLCVHVCVCVFIP